MSIVNYNITIANTTGSQTVEIVDCSNNTSVFSTTKSHANGTVSDTVDTGATTVPSSFKIRVTDGTTVQEGACESGVCSYAYEVYDAGFATGLAACQSSTFNYQTLYSSSSSVPGVTEFYTDSALTTIYSGGTGQFHRIAITTFPNSFYSGQLMPTGSVNTLTQC